MAKIKIDAADESPITPATGGMRSLLKRLLNPLLSTLVPLARLPIRYSRCPRLRHFLWGMFSWRPHVYADVRTEFGMRMSGDSRDLIQKYLYFFGAWEQDIIHWARERLSSGEVFVDVGANIGWYSLATSGLVGERGKVVAIEASPRIFRQLQANIDRNGLRNVRAINVAAASERKSLPLFDGGEANIGETTTVPGVLEQSSLIEIPAEPLSELLTPEEQGRVRLIKIDVEGAELEVLQGLLPALDNMPQALEIITEVSPERLEKQGQTQEQLFEILGRKGFYPYRFAVNNRPEAYLDEHKPVRPKRLRGTLDRECDVVFSRLDAEFL